MAAVYEQPRNAQRVAYEITSYSRPSYCPSLYNIICAFHNVKISNEPNYKLSVTF